jgi:tRNA modification GTPase
LNDWERRELSNERPDRLVVLTKVDVVPPGEAPGPAGLSGYDVATSSATGAGIERLRQRVREALLGTAAANRVGVAGTASRCRDSLRQAAEALDSARAAVAAGLGEELIAMEIRAALDELGRVVGAVYTDDVLDVIFSRFCLGK